MWKKIRFLNNLKLKHEMLGGNNIWEYSICKPGGLDLSRRGLD